MAVTEPRSPRDVISRSHGLPRHRRRRLHRIQHRRRAGRPRRPGDGARRPLDGQAGQPGGRARARAPPCTWPTSATRRRSPRSSLATRPEVVFHLAAQIDVRHSVERARGRRHHQRARDHRRAGGGRRHGVRRVVNTSTGGGLYGDADVLPTPEDHPIRPLAPYGQSKLAAEGYCELYTRLHGLSTVSLRYGNVYGPRQDVHGEAGVVAIFCGHLVEGRAPRCSATAARRGTGSTSPMSCGPTCWPPLLSSPGPVNIGHGRETSVLDLMAALRDAASDRPLRRAAVRARPARRGAPQLSRCHPGPPELGWEATGVATRRAADDPGRSLTQARPGGRRRRSRGRGRVRRRRPAR